jgi:alanyl-tRNA synthetase
MNAQDIRNSYLKYYEERQHKQIARAPLVLQNDPTTLFTGSGMQQLMPYLLGETHPEGVRLVDSQPSFRAQDIEEVGDNRHTTFFEMLGNWSLGDYFKTEQLPWIFEFMIDVVKLDINKFYVTCFLGDPANNIPKDTDSGEIWQKLFASKGVEAGEVEVGSEADGYNIGTPSGVRIFYYDASKNWWCRGGKIGDMPVGEPGGPDSEMFYRFDDTQHTDAEKQTYGELCHPNCDCGRYMEIGNNVFMEYVRRESGFEKLPAQNVDQGAGLERIAAAALDNPDVFKISLLWPIIEKLQDISGKSYDSHTNSMRVIADHLRGATFLAVDGVVPSNKEQGYVMRRLLRRAIRFAFDLGVEQNFLEQVVPVIADLYQDDYPEIKDAREDIIATLVKEEKVFRQTLRKGLQEFVRLTTPTNMLSGADVFTLYDTYGFPIELSMEEAFKRNVGQASNINGEFDKLMTEQRTRSQTAAKGTFKGGLGGQTEQHKKYHTATHLMYQALRQVLGDHVVQHGSNITEERLRFDFSHPDKMTPEQIKQVEDIVNEQIDKDLKVSFREYSTKVAREEMGALGAFGDRYGDTVKVYKMIADNAAKPFSFEICGGPHVDHTMQLAEGGKHFNITKEESSSAGIRRIKALLS